MGGSYLRAGGSCRVLVTSPTVLVAEVVAGLLHRDGGFEASWCQWDDAAERADVVDPDIVLADVGADDRFSSPLRQGATSQLVFLVRDVQSGYDELAKCAGGVGWLTCHVEPNELVRSLRTLASVGRLPQLPIARRRPTPPRTGDEFLVQQLTSRERQVLGLLASGRRADAIAEVLGISQNTVRTHVQNVMLKLAVHTRLEAVALAHRVGLANGRVIDLRDGALDDGAVAALR